MAYRYLENIDERLIEAIYKIGAENGVERITAVKIAKECGVSNFTAASHFGSMEGAFIEAATRAHNEIQEELMEAIDEGADLGMVWDKMIEILLRYKERSLFVMSFFTLPIASKVNVHIFQMKDIERIQSLFGAPVSMSVWNAFSGMAVCYATRVLRGSCEDSEEERATIKKAVMNGFQNLGK